VADSNALNRRGVLVVANNSLDSVGRRRQATDSTSHFAVMPLELGIWKLDGSNYTPHKVAFSAPDLELHLEKAIAQDLSIVAPGLMLLGRQVVTPWRKFIDILAIDSDGNLVVLELKRDKTPREVVAQALDYGSWVQNLAYDDITRIFAESNPGAAFESAFEESLGVSPPEVLGASHRLLIVAADLDPATERILNYINGFGVPINVVFFHFFRDGDSQFLARTWLRDPFSPDQNAPQPSLTPRTKMSVAASGGDFYVNVSDDVAHNWDDCRRYGFIAAGGGRRYSRPLFNLFEGARVFVNIPGKGYVGVGIVEGPPVAATKAKINTPEGEKNLVDLPLIAPNMARDADDEELCEYIVPVRWLKTSPREEAYRESGMFGNQNIVCRLTNAFTLDKLITHFGLQEEDIEIE